MQTRSLISTAGGSSPATFDYYISTTGSSGNLGTEVSPWDISALWTKSAIAGKRIGLADGTYIITGLSGGNGAGKNLQYGGSSGSPTTIEAVNARQAIVTTNNGGSYPTSTTEAFNISGTYITLKNLKFSDFSWDPILISASNTVIDSCDFDGIDTTPLSGFVSGDNTGFIYFVNDPTFLIKNCKFNDVFNGSGAGDNGCCIGPIYHNGNGIIEYCEFYNSVNAIGIKSDNPGTVDVRYNYFDSTISRAAIKGLVSDNNSGVVKKAYNNIFNRCGNVSDSFDASSSDNQCQFEFYNNTRIITSASNGFGYAAVAMGSTTSGLPVNRRNLSNWYNNIFHYVSGTAPLLFLYADSATPIQYFNVIDYNLYPSSNIRVTDNTSGGGGAISSLATWQTRLSDVAVTGQEAHTIQGAATFTNVNGSAPEDFQLNGGTGVGAGKVGGLIGGASVNMGAWDGIVTRIGCDF